MPSINGYRLSRYVLEVPASEEFTILHSTLYGSTAVISSVLLHSTHDRITNSSDTSLQLDPEDIRRLVEQEILISDDVDERDRIRYLVNSAKFNYTAMEVALVATRACNFRCKYCTEAGRFSDAHMTDETADAAVNYIKNVADAKGTQHLTVGFYGGEPLLNLEGIVHAAHALREAFRSTRTKLVLFAVTNGYELTPKAFDRLADAGVVSFQVTLDGPKDVHDSRRVLRGGGATWERIVRNMIALVQDERLNALGIRINIDRHSSLSVPHLLDELQEQQILADTRRVQAYIAPVIPSFHPEDNWNSYVLRGREKGEVFVRLWEEMATRGLPVVAFPNVFPCGLHVEWGTLVDPSGDLYACSGFLGMSEYVKGKLPDGRMSRSHLRFLTEPLPDRCEECCWAPLCGGGCKYIAAITGRQNCEKAFFDLAYPAFVRISTQQDVEWRDDLQHLSACL